MSSDQLLGVLENKIKKKKEIEKEETKHSLFADYMIIQISTPREFTDKLYH